MTNLRTKEAFNNNITTKHIIIVLTQLQMSPTNCWLLWSGLLVTSACDLLLVGLLIRTPDGSPLNDFSRSKYVHHNTLSRVTH